jgi:hypothetical protein
VQFGWITLAIRATLTGSHSNSLQDDDEALAHAMRNPQQRHADALVEVIAEMRRLDGLPGPYDPEDQWIPKAWGRRPKTIC